MHSKDWFTREASEPTFEPITITINSREALDGLLHLLDDFCQDGKVNEPYDSYVMSAANRLRWCIRGEHQ